MSELHATNRMHRQSSERDGGVDSERMPARSALLVGVRYVLPSVVTLAGIVVMALGGETDLEGGAAIVSAGLATFLLNWLFRAGVSGERQRDAEDAAREFLTKHGHWPD